MCGIYITNIPFKEEEVIDKLESISFRGPDNLGYERIGTVSMGHLRLSILDLDSRSNQPYSYNHLRITFNGEIYNFEDIKKELLALNYNFETTSDTEVLVKGYLEWGKDLLAKLNGMFAFAIYDTDKDIVFCARDRLGVKPFFYYWKDGKFEISSQLRPLINSESKVSREAVSIYLDCGYVPSPYSIIENIFKLSPGNFMEIDLNKGTKLITSFWNLKQVIIRDISYDEAKKELHELLIDAVKIRMQADVPLGSFLSGGVDSALVSAIASEISDAPINTFTIGFEDPKYDESKVAKQFSQIIGSNHTETICGPNDAINMLEKMVEVFDEPFADSSALPSLLLNSVTKQYVTVALSGDGGDESFLGYEHFDKLKTFNNIRFIPQRIRNFAANFDLYKILGGRPETLKGVLQTKNDDDFAWNTFNGFETLQVIKETSWFKNYNGYKIWSSDSIQRMADLNIKLWLENDSNVKVDRSSMAYAMEIRSPFLDFRVIEFARSLPIEYRYKKGLKKRITKDILSKYIPEEVFNLPKKGFSIPLGEWIRKELKEQIEDALNDDFLKSVPNLDILKFKKQMHLHMTCQYDYSFNIWKLFVLAKWYEEFKLS
ncbi:asparagine synthase (glutamine-hydrolysing) [Flavobacterium tiangeerense]|uniref:asparagine synthase (glutamine-hydrolyzing) n=1 Tax=Flavobacterium tiangeerense TaxID=459471 RepID=A0ABY3FK04_9FLAO|nr:asparagine synthase (glutamine-hydrolyzing) [Flavobacterium tiangeerense]TWH99146.1 asparagine synthase (glutamine-hydrolysing) [Flavobacterium tiangeerense]